MTEPELSRRRMLGLLGAGAAGVAAGGWVTWRLNDTDVAAGQGRARSPSTTAATTTSSVTSTTDPVADTTTTTEPVRYRPYTTVRDEVFADAKLVGTRAVEALMLYEAGEASSGPVERAMGLAAPDLRAGDLEASAGSLWVPDATSIPQVVYPQLGGLHPHSDPTTASIMVVVEQRLRSLGGSETISRCVDVRVRRLHEVWVLDSVADASGDPVAPPPSLSDEALRVLQHDDIDMPDSVRWDIYDGIVDDRILFEMAELADQTPIGVTTCMRGHPINVFGTAGRSAHSVGRAVDIWEVGLRPVVQQRDDTGSVAHAVAESLFEQRRVHRLGAPWAFDGGGGRSWTDPVHKDHLHLGVSA